MVEPEALQRAMRSQFPAPEIAPDASEWMREIVTAVGSNPFLQQDAAMCSSSSEHP